jgi:hypothetical protein
MRLRHPGATRRARYVTGLVAAIGLAAGTVVAATSGAVSAVLDAATSEAASAAPACQVAYAVNPVLH